MKYSLSILTTLTLVTTFAFFACENPDNNKMQNAETSVIEANRDLEIAKSEVNAELRIYREKNAERIMEFNREIADIKRKLKEESDMEDRVRLEEQLEESEESLRELKSEMDNYQASNRDNWNDFKESFTDRMDDLENDLENFFSPSTTTTSIN